MPKRSRKCSQDGLQKLVEENARLTEAVAARDAFLAVAAHELRNPMTPIVGRVSMLRRAVDKGNLSAEKLTHDLDQIEWLMGLFMKRAKTLLDISRLTTNKFHVERELVDICEVARAVAMSYRPLAAYSGSTLEFELPSEPVEVMGDWLALEQVLDNLVSNAIKYGAGKPICVTVAAAAPVARLLVKDEGPGISDESQTRIFERFERVVGSGTDVGGFGVGLWIVRQLCDAMDATIEVASVAGTGSTFSVTIPMPSQELV